MSDAFPVIDALALDETYRTLLQPDEARTLRHGATARLPRYFYQIDSWQQAQTTKLTPHFTLAELMMVDCREATPLLREFPHYVPCTISILARYLEALRERVDAPVFVAVNGGYRSPAHCLNAPITLHSWATAADIYRIGDTLLDDERNIERYAQIARSLGQEIRVLPYGHTLGQTDDHLHLDLGFLHWAPA